MGRRLAALALLAAGLPLAANTAQAITINDATAAAAGGISNYFDSTNTFPTTVELFAGGGTCTGTLINSRTILTAAHCVTATNAVTNTVAAGDNVSFSPTAANGAAGNVLITGAVRNATYAQSAGVSGDIAMISLATPVTGLTPVVLMQPSQPIPGVGTVITMVGYGLAGTGTTGAACNAQGVCLPGTVSDDKRRISMSELGYYGPANTAPVVLSASTQAFYMAQFRNPDSPAKPDSFGLNALGIPTQALEGGVASGDSGGPLFVNINGVMTEIGEVSGGTNPTGGPTSGYGDVNQWTPVALFSSWLAQNSPLRQISSNAGNFNWSNPAAWSDSIAGVTAQVPNNTVGSVNGFLNVANYFNVTLANTGTITTDISPTIDSLSIAGAGAQLSIAANTTLTTAVGSQMTAGMLAVGGSLSTQALTLTGGQLSGTGQVVATGGVTNTGATVSPGTAAALGTLSIQGNYTQSGTGALTIRLAQNTSDVLAVTGRATLGGGLQVQPTNGPYTTGTVYNALTAGGGVAGVFANVQMPQLTALLGLQTTYLAGAVQLSVVQNVPLAAVAVTPIQMAVAKALVIAAPTLPPAQPTAQPTGTTAAPQPAPALALAVASADVLNAPTLQQAQQDLDELAGDDAGATSGSGETSGGNIIGNHLTANMAVTRIVGDALDAHIDMLRDQTGAAVQAAAGLHGMQFNFANRAGGQIAAASATDSPSGQIADAGAAAGAVPYRLWAQGIGAWDNLRSDGQSPGLTEGVGGVIAGIDGNPFVDALPWFKGGVAFAYTNAGLNADDESGTTNAYRFSVYGTGNAGPAFVEARVGAGYDQMSTTRQIAFDGLNETATASPNGNDVSAKFAAGYRLDYGMIHLEPSGGIAFDRVTRAGYSESGAGTLDLNVAGNDYDSLRLIAGVRGQTSFDLGNGFIVTPMLSASFEEYALDDLPTSALAFAGAPGDVFTITGVKPGRQAGLFSGGLTVGNGRGIAAFAEYTGEVRLHETTQAVVGGLRLTW